DDDRGCSDVRHQTIEGRRIGVVGLEIDPRDFTEVVEAVGWKVAQEPVAQKYEDGLREDDLHEEASRRAPSAERSCGEDDHRRTEDEGRDAEGKIAVLRAVGRGEAARGRRLE